MGVTAALDGSFEVGVGRAIWLFSSPCSTSARSRGWRGTPDVVHLVGDHRCPLAGTRLPMMRVEALVRRTAPLRSSTRQRSALGNRFGPGMTLAADAPTTEGRENPTKDISRIVPSRDRKTFRSSTFDREPLRGFENRAGTVQPVAGAEALEPNPGPDRSAVRIHVGFRLTLTPGPGPWLSTFMATSMRLLVAIHATGLLRAPSGCPGHGGAPGSGRPAPGHPSPALLPAPVGAARDLPAGDDRRHLRIADRTARGCGLAPRLLPVALRLALSGRPALCHGLRTGVTRW